MLYIDTRPTFKLVKEEAVIEIFLMGGEECHLCGQELRISLCDRPRQKLRFENLDTLHKQITRDEEVVQRYFQLSD